MIQKKIDLGQGIIALVEKKQKFLDIIIAREYEYKRINFNSGFPKLNKDYNYSNLCQIKIINGEINTKYCYLDKLLKKRIIEKLKKIFNF